MRSLFSICIRWHIFKYIIPLRLYSVSGATLFVFWIKSFQFYGLDKYFVLPIDSNGVTSLFNYTCFFISNIHVTIVCWPLKNDRRNGYKKRNTCKRDAVPCTWRLKYHKNINNAITRFTTLPWNVCTCNTYSYCLLKSLCILRILPLLVNLLYKHFGNIWEIEHLNYICTIFITWKHLTINLRVVLTGHLYTTQNGTLTGHHLYKLVYYPNPNPKFITI